MSSSKLLISMPDALASRWKAAVPARKRSLVIRRLIEEEIKRRERVLYDCAHKIEADEKLSEEMKDWDITSGDGISDNESW